MDKDYTKLRKQALKLRESGLSYGNIARQLQISKSTISYWSQDIKLTLEQKKELNNNRTKHLNYGPNSQKNRRIREIKKILIEAENDIGNKISFDSYRLFGAALYWAEGNKVTDFTVTNSDPLLIKFMCQWFSKVFNITPDSLGAHLNIYPQQNEVEIKKFWSDITGIPFEKFGKTFIKPLNKNYKKNTLYYGTIKVRVKKGTDFRYKVFGWINKVLKNTGTDIEKIEKKWYKLRNNYMRP